eukprot:747158-Prymnesium_polylepis.1
MRRAGFIAFTANLLGGTHPLDVRSLNGATGLAPGRSSKDQRLVASDASGGDDHYDALEDDGPVKLSPPPSSPLPPLSIAA